MQRVVVVRVTSLWQALVSVIWRDVQCVTVPCPQFRPLAWAGARPPAHALDQPKSSKSALPSPNLKGIFRNAMLFVIPYSDSLYGQLDN